MIKSPTVPSLSARTLAAIASTVSTSIFRIGMGTSVYAWV